MEINQIISQLKDKFGDKIDVAAITEKFHGIDTSKLSFAQISDKIKDTVGDKVDFAHLTAALGDIGKKFNLGDLDGDGKVESPIDEIKGKATEIFSSIFHK